MFFEVHSISTEKLHTKPKKLTSLRNFASFDTHVTPKLAIIVNEWNIFHFPSANVEKFSPLLKTSLLTFITPSGIPGVFHKPVILVIFRAIANNQDTMIEIIRTVTAVGLIKNTWIKNVLLSVFWSYFIWWGEALVLSAQEMFSDPQEVALRLLQFTTLFLWTFSSSSTRVIHWIYFQNFEKLNLEDSSILMFKKSK